LNIIEAAADPNLFAPWFRDRATWRAWFAFLRALFGLPLSPDDRSIFTQCTGRARPAAGPALLVSDRQREAVGGPARRVHEAGI
jgi:hypothetical protein